MSTLSLSLFPPILGGDFHIDKQAAFHHSYESIQTPEVDAGPDSLNTFVKMVVAGKEAARNNILPPTTTPREDHRARDGHVMDRVA
jgi:hypothetical protein